MCQPDDASTPRLVGKTGPKAVALSTVLERHVGAQHDEELCGEGARRHPGDHEGAGRVGGQGRKPGILDAAVKWRKMHSDL